MWSALAYLGDALCPQSSLKNQVAATLHALSLYKALQPNKGGLLVPNLDDVSTTFPCCCFPNY
jgi:hypothetical protein